MNTLSDLERRLQEATGPDRQADYALARAAGYELDIIRVPAGHPVFKEGGGLEFMMDADGNRTGIPPYTASLDAVLALVERVLPKHDWVIGHTNGGLTVHAQLGPSKETFHETPALALCLALIRALKEKDNEEGE